jgi:hypothetical protein
MLVVRLLSSVVCGRRGIKRTSGELEVDGDAACTGTSARAHAAAMDFVCMVVMVW